MESGAHIRLVLGRAAKAIESLDRSSISSTGLNISDFSILEALLHKGPLPINTIGKKILLTSGSMTTAANRLAKKGLIKRVKDPSDGRFYFLHLTRNGQELITKVYAQHAQNLEKLAGALNSQERSQLVTLLKKIGRHAQEIEIDQDMT
jgi:MarR family 2-MHQ and catechol resistance regulon transcriptional repressor